MSVQFRCVACGEMFEVGEELSTEDRRCSECLAKPPEEQAVVSETTEPVDPVFRPKLGDGREVRRRWDTRWLLVICFFGQVALLMAVVPVGVRRSFPADAAGMIRQAFMALYVVAMLPAWILRMGNVPDMLVVALGILIWMVPLGLISAGANRACRILAWFALAGVGALCVFNLVILSSFHF